MEFFKKIISKKMPIWLAVTFIMVAIVITKTITGSFDKGTFASVAEDKSPLIGIDISVWQDGEYVDLIHGDGVEFVFARAQAYSEKTKGVSNPSFAMDRLCEPICQTTKEAGKLLGLYFFAYISDDPVAYAKECAKNVESYVGEAIMALDMEPDGGVDPDWAFKWLTTFEATTGVRPMIYLNLSSVNDYDWSKIQARGHELWLADYGAKDDGVFQEPRHTQYWRSPKMHQYTEQGKVLRNDQLVAKIDRNIFYGTVADWRALATVHEAWKH